MVNNKYNNRNVNNSVIIMKCRDILRNGKKIGEVCQSNKGVSIKVIDDKDQVKLESQLIKPLNRITTDKVNTIDFPLSISNKETIMLNDPQWLNEIVYHLPMDLELGEIYG